MWIITLFYLIDSTFCILIPFQFNDHSWFIPMLFSRKIYNICKTLSGRQLSYFSVISPCAIICKRNYACQCIFVIICQYRRFKMCFLDFLCNCLIFPFSCCLKQFFRILYCQNYFLPSCIPYGGNELCCNLTIRNKYFFF